MKRTSLSLVVFSFLICCALPESALQRASCLDPNSPNKTITRCTETIDRGDQEPPSNRAAAYKNRGNAYLFNGKLDDAIADFTKSIRLSPDADVLHQSRCCVLSKGRRRPR